MKEFFTHSHFATLRIKQALQYTHYHFLMSLVVSVRRKLMKAKGPAAAKVEEGKKKGLALFGPKPATPKLIRAVGGGTTKTFIEKLKVTHFHFHFCHFFHIYM